ncbi:hypothetical protein [Pseudomonas sp. F(2018)]|uniref:hypothetical protein n=1 Tax=Pseudomonas sp. F(2018) TaxID=2502240 RepID=UPI0010F52CBD|nr:hypothetical protein [Pseudomonas sp. F(2018)]
MTWLDDGVDEAELASQAQRIEFTSEGPQTGVWQGFGTGFGDALELGGISASNMMQAAGSASFEQDLAISSLYFPDEADEQIEAQQQEQQRLSKDTAEAVQELRADPRTVGVAGQILNTAAEVLPRTAAAALLTGPAGIVAGPLAAGAPAGYTATQVAKADGVDDATATAQGLIEGVATTVGAGLPAARFVKPILGDAAIAVGANVAIGMASRGATASLLESNGYTAQAAQYRAMDGTAVLTDAVLGAAFFGLGRASVRRPNTQQIDAALTERQAVHADIDTAPGAPTTPRAAVAHQEALRMAIEQVTRGEPVSLPDSIHTVDFLRSADELPPIRPPRADIEASARAEALPIIRAELEQQAALAVPNVRDLKTELAGLRRTVDGLDATFRERAKAFQEQGASRKQAEAQARQAIQQERAQVEQRQQAITEQLDGNRAAEQARGELAAMDRGELPARFEERVTARAAEMEQGFQRRPLANQVAEGNTRLSMREVAQQEIIRILDDLERAEPTLVARPLDIGASKGVAKPEVTSASKTAKPASEPAESATDGAKGASTTPDSASPEAGARAADPELAVVDEIMARVDDMQLPTGAIDADGKPVTVSARQLLSDADADIQRAQQESNGFAAAAACFLQRGA